MTITRYTCWAILLACLGGVLASPVAYAQAPGWQTAVAVTTTSPGVSEILHTAADASGNVLVAGEFQGTITLGSSTLSSPSVRTPFAAKWNTAMGTWAWATALSCTETSFAGGLAVVGTSIYLSGSFKGTATAGSLTMSSPASYNVFVAKLTDNGPTATWVWAQQAGGSNDDFGNGLAVQGTSVYTVGLVYSTTLTFGGVTVTTPNSGSTFVAKLTDTGPSGSYNWALLPTGLGFAWLRTLAVQGTAVYAAGEMQGTKTFGSTTLATSSSNDADVLLAKITDTGAAGTWAWAQRAGGPGTDRAVTVAATGTSVYMAGDSDGTSAVFGTTTLSNAGSTDVFVAKFADAGPTGTWAWAQRAGGTANDVSRGLLVRGTSVYVSGEVASTPATFGSINLLPTSNAAAFVARLTDVGTGASFVWAQSVGSTYFSTASTLASSGLQVYLGGSTSSVTTFGNQTIIGSSNVQYGFLAAITDATALPTLVPVAAAEAEAIALYPNPAHGTATVQLPAGLAAGTATLTVLDGMGRVVRSRTSLLASGATTTGLDVAGLAPGVYALRVAVGECQGTTRLVVE